MYHSSCWYGLLLLCFLVICVDLLLLWVRVYICPVTTSYRNKQYGHPKLSSQGNMSFRYVRAIYDFPASRPDEVPLRKGDVALVLKDLDPNWVRGVMRQTEGVFPVTFVEPLGLPEVQKGEKVFAGIEGFGGGEDGDLCFERGDILIGTTAVDENWWEGYSTSTHARGIFPLTHVEELDPRPPQGHGTQGHNRSMEQATEVLAEARVIKGLEAQLEEELALIEGETVQILRFLDDSFGLGQCGGKVGQFPLSFVQLIGENSCRGFGSSYDNTITQVSKIKESGHGTTVVQNNGYLTGKKSHSRKGSYTQANTRSHDAFVLPYAQTRHPFAAVNENELSFCANEIVTLISHIDDDWAEGEINGRRGIFPTSYVNIIVDCQPIEEANRGQNGSTIVVSPETYGRVLYDFTAESSEELSLQEGDTVTILQKLDADWYLAQHDDSRIGRCPVSYVEVFGCEPLHGVTTPSGEATKALQPVVSNLMPHDVSMTEVKPKPMLKPKPILKTSSMSASHGGGPVKSNDFKQHSTNANSISFNIGGKPVDDCRQDSPIAKRRPFQQVNARMSLDEVVQRQLQQVRCHGSGFQCENSGSEMAMQDRPPMFSVRPRSVSVLGNEAAVLDERGSSTKVELHAAYPSMSAESPLPMARSSRPDSLNVLAKQSGPQGAKGAAKKKPTPPPRPSGSKPSPPKLVPKRPAPPCPVIDRSGRSHSHNDLMIFSPEKGTSDMLQTSLSTPSMDRPIPMPSVRSSLSTTTSASDLEVERQREKRQCVISELIHTESDYVNSLVLCLKTFSSMAKSCPPALDLDVLFGNSVEVVELSQRLLAALEQNVEAKSPEMQCVGKCFTELKDQFQRVYAPYCRNHDNVMTLLEKYESNAEVSEFIRSALDQMRQHSQIFNLNSILIKPVQRILKYPLLLSELERSTEDGHVDKLNLGTAINTMTNIASYINEYKRRKDLVFKYKSETDVKFSDKIGRLTMHSTMKKLSRISRKMVGIQTVDEQFNCEEQRFKFLDSAIRNLTRDVSQYIEQCENALECRELVAVNISEIFDKETPELAIEKLCNVHQQISSVLFGEFKAEVESDILPPLNSLILMYQGPHKVIRKRYDKLLDFDNASARLRSVGDSDQVKAMDEELAVARKNYEALNAQLLDDLPKLYDLSMSILVSCLTMFIQSQQRFLKQSLDKLHDLLGLPLLLGTGSSSNVVETFNIAHAIAVEKMSVLSFIPKSFNPQVDQVRRMKEQRRATIGNCEQLIDVDSRVSQCEGQRSHLRQTYPAGRLFWVSQDFVGSQTMDLNLSTGSLIAVIKEGDPMGNRDRWFVDNGAEKGFVLKQFLSGQHPVMTASSGSVSQKAVDLLDWLDPIDSMGNGNVLNPIGGATCTEKTPLANMKEWVYCEDDFPPNPPLRQNSSASVADHSPQPSTEVLYQAVYEFHARNSNELSMSNGQVFRVIAKQDLDGNSEWWEVENENGQRGYVPASYLYAAL